MATILKDQINELLSNVAKKEEKLEGLFKLTSKAISDYDVETAKMVETTHVAHKKEVENAQVIKKVLKQI